MATQISTAQSNLPAYYLTLLATSAPSVAPSTGWVLFSDINDSQKLKALAHTGTTVVLGTP